MDDRFHCIAFDHGKQLGDIPLDQISDVLSRDETFVWVNLQEPDEALLAKMQEEFALHELAIEDARVAKQRPKLESYGAMVFIVLKTTRLEGDALMFGELHLFVGPNFLVSVVHGHAVEMQRVRERCDAMPSMMAKGPAFVLYALLDDVVDQYRPGVEHYEEAFEKLEQSVFGQSLDRLLIARVYELKRHVLKLRNVALPVSNICSELMRLHEEIIPKELRAYFRDVQDHVSHVIAMADSMQEMLTSAMQVNLALVGFGQNEVVKRLAGWGAILAVPTVIFSLYGMNFKRMPELDWPYGYPAVLALTVVLIAVVYSRLRKIGWV